MTIIVNENGLRYCKDNFYRGFACFGSYGCCVKFYSAPRYAKATAKRIGGRVAEIPDHFTMDASGKIYEMVETRPGFEKPTQHQIEEFIVGVSTSIMEGVGDDHR